MAFALDSATITAVEMTAALEMEPDRVTERGSKSVDPPRPAFHGWEVQASDGNPDSFTERVDALVQRLEPVADRLTVLVQRILQDPNGGPYPQQPQVRGGAVLSVVRCFGDGAEAPHHLGLHLSERTIRFLGAVGACVDIDEYDDRQ